MIKMREADIPLEGNSKSQSVVISADTDLGCRSNSVMWNDIDLYHAVRDFTTDPVSYPGEDVRAFIKELVSKIKPIRRRAVTFILRRATTTNAVRGLFPPLVQIG